MPWGDIWKLYSAPSTDPMLITSPVPGVDAPVILSSETASVADGLRETGDPTSLAMGAVADGEYLRRSSSTVVGDTPTGAGMAQHGNEYHTPDMATAQELANHMVAVDPHGFGPRYISFGSLPLTGQTYAP
jgi:hypothetical protein